MSKVFLTGATGYIGGTVLTELVRSGRYAVTALTRSDSKSDGIRKAGATPFVGSTDDAEVLKKVALDYDIIIHIGDSADHLPSATAFLDGIAARSPSQPPAIYIHTSGTGVISDEAQGEYEAPKVYSDITPDDINSLPDTQPHREIDIHVMKRAKELEGKATVAIIIPPLIYGQGTGPYNQNSIQVPALIRYAIKSRFVPSVGQGLNRWNNVHVVDLARGYLVLLEALKEGQKDAGGYYFAETGEHQWKDIYTRLAQRMHAKGLVDAPTPRNMVTPEEKHALFGNGKDAYDAWGGNSRCDARRLRALGWKKQEDAGLFDCMEAEIDRIAKVGV